MGRVVKCGLIQASNPINDESVPVAEIQKAMLDKHLAMIDEAGNAGVQILCLQEIFNGPYFCPSQDTRWYDATEPVPGPTTAIVDSGLAAPPPICSIYSAPILGTASAIALKSFITSR